VGQVSNLPPAIFLMGPTASGKTGLAVELAQSYPLDIISVDSAMVYRQMDIGTAKPSADILRIAPHRLINIRDAAESYSAAEFRTDALAEMASITAQGRIPLLVGGTVLYFRALSGGLAVLPAADAALRERLEQEAAAIGWPAMHQRLQDLDPDVAARIHPNDPQRIQRALEVISLSGRRMSELHAESPAASPGYRILRIVVCPDSRSELHQRINRRFTEMLDQGFLPEVQGLMQRGDLHPGMPSMRCVGYRQAWAHLQGETTYPAMVQQAQAATRQLAKRQLTWLRQETEALWYDLQQQEAQNRALQKVRRDFDRFLES
jgi:tRNA dimethylallyltransferase